MSGRWQRWSGCSNRGPPNHALQRTRPHDLFRWLKSPSGRAAELERSAAGGWQMTTWRDRLRKLVRVAGRLPAPFGESFSVRPPSGRRWPARVAPCPALQEFYALCDGGTFSHYSLDRLAMLQTFQGDDAAEPGQYVGFGNTGFGHPLVWDGAADRVGYHDLDGADGFVWSEETGAELMGRTMADFLAGLFSPPRHTRGDPTQQMWAQVLADLERLAEEE